LVLSYRKTASYIGTFILKIIRETGRTFGCRFQVNVLRMAKLTYVYDVRSASSHVRGKRKAASHVREIIGQVFIRMFPLVSSYRGLGPVAFGLHPRRTEKWVMVTSQSGQGQIVRESCLHTMAKATPLQDVPSPPLICPSEGTVKATRKIFRRVLEWYYAIRDCLVSPSYSFS